MKVESVWAPPFLGDYYLSWSNNPLLSRDYFMNLRNNPLISMDYF